MQFGEVATESRLSVTLGERRQGRHRKFALFRTVSAYCKPHMCTRKAVLHRSFENALSYRSARYLANCKEKKC